MSLDETMFSIFRGHIPDQAVRAISPAPLHAGAIMGVLAVAGLTIGVVAAALWAIVWLAITLI